jgi:hypothetical protein
MSTTHHYDPNQRLLWLSLQPGATTPNSVTVDAPLNGNLAPPGYYMIHVLTGPQTNKIPSKGTIIQIPGPNVTTFYDVPKQNETDGGVYTGNSIRYGVEVRPGSALIGRPLKKWTLYLKKVGSPQGLITATVRRPPPADNIVASFVEQPNSTALSTTYAPVTFTMATPYIIQELDKIMIEYNGQNGVDVDVNTNSPFDGALTRRVRYTGSTYISADAHDVIGTMTNA